MRHPTQFLAEDRPNALARLMDFLRIPSVSTDPAYKAGIEQAAAWVARQLSELGLDTHVHATGGHPCVVAKTRAADLLPGAEKAPAILFYGHYDVQPPDPLEKWNSPPFEPVVRDGKLFARGASDDKGQVMCFIEALRAWKQTAGKFPVRITALIEGEEECGSVNLPAFINHNKGLLASDIAVVSDTAMWDRDTPSLTYGLRGLLYFDVKLHNSNRDLHSGVYGGSLANPATMLGRVIGRLFDAENKVTIPGFYDDVDSVSAAEKAAWDQLNFDEARDLLKPIGVAQPFGEAGFSTLERRWARPSCDVNGLYGGYMGEGAKTVIPSFAGAKISFRLAPNQKAAKIAKMFDAWLRKQDVGGCRWEITQFGGADPVRLSTDSPYVAAAQRAMTKAAGRPAKLAREGATIPVVADFKSALGVDTLLAGFGLHDDALHSPNEKFDLHCFELGCRTHALLLEELGELRK